MAEPRDAGWEKRGHFPPTKGKDALWYRRGLADQHWLTHKDRKPQSDRLVTTVESLCRDEDWDDARLAEYLFLMYGPRLGLFRVVAHWARLALSSWSPTHLLYRQRYSRKACR